MTSDEPKAPRDPPFGLPLLAGDPLEALLWGPLRAAFGLTPEQWRRLTEVVTLHMVLDRLLFVRSPWGSPGWPARGQTSRGSPAA